MLTPHMLDQAHAAAMHGNRFRVMAEDAGRFLTVVEGPLIAPALAWAGMPAREWLKCEHLPRTAPPQPLIGTLYRPGELLCIHCGIKAAARMPHTCAGCGADLDPADLDNRDVVIGLDNFLTLIGLACPACRALCDPAPETS